MINNLKKKNNTKIYFNILKKKQLNFYKQKFNYIYIIRYINLNLKEINFLKKELKQINFNLYIIKKKINKKYFLFSKGSLFIVYGNNSYLLKKKDFFQKINLIFLKKKNNLYYEKKIKKLFLFFENENLNKFLMNFFLIFLYYLREIKYIK